MPRYFYEVYYQGEYVETITVEASNEQESKRQADAEVNPTDEAGWEVRFSGEDYEFNEDDAE